METYKKKYNPNLFFLLITGFISYIFLSDAWSAIGITYFIFLFQSYLHNLKSDIPIRETILLMACFQWVIGPIVEYQTTVEHFKYFMYVDSGHYFSYIIPGMFALHAGLFTFSSKINKENFLNYVQRINVKYPYLGVGLVIAGIIGTYGTKYVPDSLQFVFYLLSQVKFVGVGFLLFSNHHYRKLIIVSVVLALIYSSISTGFFHEFIIWSVLLFPFFHWRFNLSNTRVLQFIFIGLIGVFVIQSIKPVLRQGLNSNSGISPIELFTSSLYSQYASGQLFDLNNATESNVRFNQGWIISAILKNVPEKTDFANGSTIVEGVYSAVVPRVLDPNKKHAGGRVDFMKYTGLPLGDNTSMGMSIIGEGYANFGYFGIVFMFAYGLIIGYFWKILSNPGFRWGNITLFLPIIFLQVIKAETDFVTVFTHIIKASIFISILFYSLRIFFRVKL